MQILVIEDEPRALAFVSGALKAEGWIVGVAHAGVEGLARALAHRYDLVVLDPLLSDVDGLELLAELHRRRPDLPVLILSARSDLETKLRCFERGAVDYVVKPFSLDEVLARIRAQLRRGHPVAADPDVLHAGSLLLDISRREVRVGGWPRELTEREFRLLQFLLEHCGEVLSREQLFADVWGHDYRPHSNVVDAAIRRLRRKLGPEAPIQTVRKVGYRVPTS